jgi:hypothetical protein
MTFDRLNRRTHLYLGVLLMPWFLLYCLSALLLSHGELFEVKQDGAPEWTRRFDQAYRLPPEVAGSPTSVIARRVLHDHGLDGRFRASLDRDGNLVIFRNKLASTIRLTYYPAKGRILAEDKRFHWQEALRASHFRSGFQQPYGIESLWAVFLDLLAIANLLWIVSGLYIWLKLKRLRFWGWVSLAGGMASFVALVLAL